MSIRQALDRFDAGFIAVNRWLIGLCMVAMTALVFVNVVTRYCFGYSIAWSEEVSRFLMIYIAFLGAGLALRQGRLIAVELFQDMLPRPLALVLRVAIGIVILAFLFLIAVLGLQYALFNWRQTTAVLRISAGIPYLAVPAGAILMMLHLLLGFRGFVERRWDHEAETDDTGHEPGEICNPGGNPGDGGRP